MSGSIVFEISLDRPVRGSREGGKALYTQLRAAILDGRLTPGLKLPVGRDSHRAFGVSRNTAVNVYERLAAEGLVVTRPGAGTFVAERRRRAPSAQKERRPARDPRLNPFWARQEITTAMNFWRDPPGRTKQVSPAPIDFRPALIDSRLFPFDVFRRVTTKQLRRLERRPASFKSPQGNQGHFPLRDAISQHIAVTRAVVCQPDDVLVTAGAQQAFDVLARSLVTPGVTTVAIEDPGYPPMRVAFAAAGAKIVPIGVDAEGLLVDTLPADVQVICVCPSHQFPLGVSMSARRRRALLNVARNRGAVIVEDDYDGEFRYEGSSIEALRSTASREVVFHVGTFSKCMLPAIRLGFVIAPAWAMRTLIAVKNSLDWHCPTPLQMGVALFIREGHLTRHVRKMRDVYGKRRRLLLDILAREFRGRLETIPSYYGMHIAAFAQDAAQFDRRSGTLLTSSVRVHTLRRYYLAGPKLSGFVFGFGAADVSEIERGLSLMRRAW